jgi:hypothetical protein
MHSGDGASWHEPCSLAGVIGAVALDPSLMNKGTVISLSLLLLLIACGKTPDHPGPGRPLLPETVPAPLWHPAARAETSTRALFGNAREERDSPPHRSKSFRRPT